MSEFTIQPQNVKNVLAEKESIAKQLNDIAGKVEAVASAGALGDWIQQELDYPEYQVLEFVLYELSDEGLVIVAQWKDFLGGDCITALVKRFGREFVASILNKIGGTIEANLICDIFQKEIIYKTREN